MNVSKIEEGDVQTYVVHEGLEWAVFFLFPRRRTISIYSSFGSWGNHWPDIGKQDFIEFLAGIDFHYAMEKFIGKRDRFKLDETLQNLKVHILYLRRHRQIDAREAADMWTFLDDLPDEPHELYHELNDCMNMSWPEDLHHYLAYDWPASAYSFWQVMWRPFFDSLVQPSGKA